jgi:hypothetical protein
MSQLAEPVIPDERRFAGRDPESSELHWRHLVTCSPLPDHSQGQASRGRRLDPGSRPPPADLAGMTNCDSTCRASKGSAIIPPSIINNRFTFSNGNDCAKRDHMS